LEKALVVLPQPKDVHKAFFFVPVASDTLKHAGAVVQGMSHHTDPRIAEGYVLTPEEC
jgi:hypothetical protein